MSQGKSTQSIYTGSSGLVLPVPNKKSYPPEFQDKSRLTYYSSLFNSIEINSSFYKLPMSSTVRKWGESVPDNFRFTFKLWREVTHNKELIYNPENVDRFFASVNTVGSKKGCILVQFPPGLTVGNVRQLETLLGVIQQADESDEWKIALEFRNRSWYNEDIYEMIEDSGMSIVLHDKPASALTYPVFDSPVVYLRFHGPSGDYKGSYTDDFLYEYAQYILEWKEEGKEVYVYFNNTVGDAVGNLLSLNNHLTRSG